jgi:hypothetical protein
MKKILLIIPIIIFLHSKIYENGEDKSTKRWRLLNPINSTIKNIYDKEKKSRVIFLKSKNMRDGFVLKMERDSKAWCKGDRRELKWDMQTNRDFVILVSLETKNGHRYLVYTSSNSDGDGYFGLGKNSIDGEWHTYKRDLNLDLKKSELDNEIIGVDSLFIRGLEVKLDNIEIIEENKSDKKSKKKRFKPKVCDIYVPKTYITNENIENDTTPPKIELLGKKRVYIPVGGEYKEMGARAIDNVDGEVEVEIYGDIDTNRVGTYTLFYKAKDRMGNISIDTRFVNVKGRAFIKKNKKYIKSQHTPKVTPKPKNKTQTINSNMDLELDLPNDSIEELMAED